jgi:hypothetical protein
MSDFGLTANPIAYSMGIRLSHNGFLINDEGDCFKPLHIITPPSNILCVAPVTAILLMGIVPPPKRLCLRLRHAPTPV